MVESMGRKVLRAVVVVATLLAASSVVLWPIAVIGLPLLFWAACGGRLARWSASLVGSLVVFIAAELVVWMAVEAIGGSPPRGAWWMAVVGVVVVPPTLAGFVLGSRRARERGAFGVSVTPSPLARLS